MIPTPQVPEPADFDYRARQPGLAWLREHSEAKRPKDYWSPFRSVLQEGQAQLCAYAAMLAIPDGQIDHFLSFKTHRHLAYEWSNYRFASALMNNLKRNHDDAILDPWLVENGWFEILLPSLQLVTTEQIPEHLRSKAEFSLKQLGLRDDERIIRWRQGFYQEYQNGHLSLEGLSEWAPLLARAIAAQANSSSSSVSCRVKE